MAKLTVARLDHDQQHALRVREASAVAALPDGRFLVADDEAGVFCFLPGARAQRVAPKIRGDLEGICVSPDASHAYTLCERSGTIWQADVSAAGLANERVLGRLPRLGKRNRGWEGITYASAHWHAGPALLAAHQRDPSLLGLFALPSLQQLARFTLPRHKLARKLLANLNDLAIDPRSGHVLLLNGRKGIVAELSRAGAQLHIERCWRIATTKRAVPEGLAFDAQGKLWLVADGGGWLRRLRFP